VSVNNHIPSPLVGEVGGGPAASAAEKNPLLAASATANAAPPPNPPHEGEGFRRLSLAPDAIRRARSLRKRMTKPERILWRALRETLPSCHWRKQVPLGPYFADFASHSAKLIIELDGGQHATAEDYDAARTRFLENQGYRVLRFWNNDVLANTHGVLEDVAEALAQASPLVGEGLDGSEGRS
jgi:very-short-patch-repair endonuclease